MDILAARKKAAERLQEQKNREKETRPAAAVVEPEAAAPQPVPVAAEPPAPPAAVPEIPAESAPAVAVPDGEPAAAPEEQAEEAPEEQARELEMLSFRLGGEEYALMVDSVKEVLKNRELTQVPNAPDYILGVTALRGPILPVIDLSRRLGLPAAVRDEKSRILVVTSNDEDTGIVVDRVTGVVRIHPDDIRPVPETIERGSEYLRGIVRKNDRLYILLDSERALGA